MRKWPSLCLITPALLAAIVAQSGPPGAALAGGMQLVYASGGAEQPAWVVEAVEHPVAIDDLSTCARIRLRMAPAPATAELRAWCVRDHVLLAFIDSTASFRALRPVGPHMTLDLPRAAGGHVRYQTLGPERETIGTLTVDVLPTTITTVDADGRTIRRLRERFALSLTTATHGVFEVPDTTHESGWRVTQEFRLVAVRR